MHQLLVYVDNVNILGGSVHTLKKKTLRCIIGKYFVNRSITDWNQLPEGTIGTSNGKTHIFKTRIRKVKTSEGK